MRTEEKQTTLLPCLNPVDTSLRFLVTQSSMEDSTHTHGANLPLHRNSFATFSSDRECLEISLRLILKAMLEKTIILQEVLQDIPNAKEVLCNIPFLQEVLCNIPFLQEVLANILITQEIPETSPSYRKYFATPLSYRKCVATS